MMPGETAAARATASARVLRPATRQIVTVSHRASGPKPKAPSFGYRPEIDGLRALAVVAVVLFHAGLGFPGGFCGVDVFFVISGYLITSLIMKDLGAGQFSMLTFWERRARRIMPAGVVVVLAVLIAGAWLLVPEDAERLAGAIKWQAVFAANLFIKRTISYFSGAAEEAPLLHTWSLAVEEQFYAIAPFALCLLFMLWRRTKRVNFPWLFGIAGVASLAYSIFELGRDPSGAFYLLPSRAWELLLGGWIAVAPRPKFVRTSTRGRILTLLGVAAVAAAYFLYDKSTTFPGVAALLPCVGAALYIWASSTPPVGGRATKFDVARWLSRREVVWIGLISYSLYLWHWPLMAFSNYWLLFERFPWLRLAAVAASFGLAFLSWRYIETPFREKRLLPSRNGMLAAAGLAIVAVFVGGHGLKLTHGFESRLQGPIAALTTEKNDRIARDRGMRQVSLEAAQRGNFLHFPAPVDSGRRIFVWGDSHARAALPGVIAAATQRQASVIAAWHGATPPLMSYIPESPFSLGKDAPRYNRAILDYIISNHIEDVVLASYWKLYQSSEAQGGPGFDSFARDLADVVARLTEAGCRVTVLLDWPSHRMKIPRLIFGENILGLKLGDFICVESQHEAETRAMRAILPELEKSGAAIVDPAPLFLAGSPEYQVEDDGYPLYYDTNHLSVRGANRLAELLLPLLR